jgi:hypothetical protein
MGLEVRCHCLKVQYLSCDHASSVSGATEPELLFHHALQLLLQLHEICCRSKDYLRRSARSFWDLLFCCTRLCVSEEAKVLAITKIVVKLMNKDGK